MLKCYVIIGMVCMLIVFLVTLLIKDDDDINIDIMLLIENPLKSYCIIVLCWPLIIVDSAYQVIKNH